MRRQRNPNATINKKLLISLFISIIFAKLITTRPFGADRDCHNYSLIYENAKHSINASFDTGFSLLAHFFSSNEISFGLFLLAITATSLLIKINLANNYNIGTTGHIFYILCILPIHEYTQTRASLAIAFGYYGLYLANEKKKFFFGAAFLAIATSIHMSTVTLLIPFIIKRLQTTGKLIYTATLILSTALLVFYFGDILQAYDRTSYYDAKGISDQKIFTAQNAIFLLILIFGAASYIRSATANNLEYYLFCLVIFATSLLLTSSMPIVGGRLLELSLPAYIIWTEKASGKSRKIIGSLLIISGIYSLYRYIFLDDVFNGAPCEL